MNETKILAAENDFAKSLDGLTEAEIADKATLAFFAMAAVARKLARENEALRARSAAA